MIENPRTPHNPHDSIRGILSDVHGVLYVHPRPIPGSAEALDRLREAGIPHLFLTNSSRFPKEHIRQSLFRHGMEIAPEHLLTAVEAAGSYLHRRGHRRIGWLLEPRVAGDVPGLTPILPGSGGAEAPVDAVLVGDLGEGFSYPLLNRAFAWVREGAELVAVARNRFYQSENGLVLDGGPFVALLEFATGQSARVVGKPGRDLFAAGCDRLGFAPHDVAMIGDDLEGDVLPAMEMGIRGVLTRTGKFRAEDYARAPQPADVVVADFAEAVLRQLAGAL